MKTCGFCGWSHPKGETPCVHVVRGPLTLLSPPHRRTKPVVPDIEGHDSAASVMSWWTRRWPERHFKPEESDNVRRAHERALADAIRAGGAPRIEAWGRHNDPVKGLPVIGMIFDAQLDSAGAWAWMRQHGVAWDDTERKGAIPAGRRSGTDVGNATEGELVDSAKLLHRKWRQHVDAPETKAGYTFRRRWARDRAGRLDRVLDDHVKQDGTLREEPATYLLRRHPDTRLTKERLPKVKKWSRFSPKMLSPEAREQWERDNNLDWVLDRGRHRLNLGAYARGDEVDHGGRDGGWARHVGVRPADKLLARKRALERVEDEVDAYLERGTDQVTARELDIQKMVETADATIYAAGVPEIVPVVQALLGGGPDENLETALARVAKAAGFETAYVRGMIADDLALLREPLRRWADGRSGGWVAVPIVDNCERLAVQRLFQDSSRAEPKIGRKAAAEPGTVYWALELADMIACRLSARVVAGLAGATREPVPGWVTASELYLAAGVLVSALQDWADDTGNPHGAPLPGAPSLPEVIAIVRAVRPGGRGLQTATRAVAALAYGVPPEALNAMVKKARA